MAIAPGFLISALRRWGCTHRHIYVVLWNTALLSREITKGEQQHRQMWTRQHDSPQGLYLLGVSLFLRIKASMNRSSRHSRAITNHRSPSNKGLSILNHSDSSSTDPELLWNYIFQFQIVATAPTPTIVCNNVVHNPSSEKRLVSQQESGKCNQVYVRSCQCFLTDHAIPVKVVGFCDCISNIT